MKKIVLYLFLQTGLHASFMYDRLSSEEASALQQKVFLKGLPFLHDAATIKQEVAILKIYREWLFDRAIKYSNRLRLLMKKEINLNLGPDMMYKICVLLMDSVFEKNQEEIDKVKQEYDQKLIDLALEQTDKQETLQKEYQQSKQDCEKEYQANLRFTLSDYNAKVHAFCSEYEANTVSKAITDHTEKISKAIEEVEINITNKYESSSSYTTRAPAAVSGCDVSALSTEYQTKIKTLLDDYKTKIKTIEDNYEKQLKDMTDQKEALEKEYVEKLAPFLEKQDKIDQALKNQDAKELIKILTEEKALSSSEASTLQNLFSGTFDPSKLAQINTFLQSKKITEIAFIDDTLKTCIQLNTLARKIHQPALGSLITQEKTLTQQNYENASELYPILKGVYGIIGSLQSQKACSLSLEQDLQTLESHFDIETKQ